MRFATSGTVGHATFVLRSAISATSAQIAEETTLAQNVQRRIETSAEYMHPKFTQNLVWGTVEDDISPAAHYSLSADPLPRPPQSKLKNVVANETICTHPDLF